MKWAYELIYRYFRPPYDTGPDSQLVRLVESGRIRPGRVIDLGCGTGRNALYLAEHGFDVTGVDFAASGIAKAKQKAQSAGLDVAFLVDDLTNLQTVTGTFDLLIDIGTLDVFPRASRELYVKNVVSLTHPGSCFLIAGWEWELRWWEQLFLKNVALEPGEIDRRFGRDFDIECILHETNPRSWGPGYFTGMQKAPGYAAYWMIRKSV